MESLGDRVKSLLKGKHISHKDFASMIGGTESALSRYINNEREPKIETIANMATALGTTVDYLTTGIKSETDFDEIYRLVARSSYKLSESQKMKIIEAVMSNKLVKIPSWRYDEIENKIVDLYIDEQINKIPINPFSIIKHEGYIAIPFSQFKQPIATASSNDEENDAFSFFSPQHNTFIIVYDDEKPLIRLRFTLMHEIGHIVLGHKCESELAKKEADYFAAYALAPSPLILYLADNEPTTIKNKFWVSNQCAEICANRFSNWLTYGGQELKNYEKKLIDLFSLQ